MTFNIFPSGSTCSLRRALLMWLVPLFLLVGVAPAAFGYWTYGRMVGTFMDHQMEQLALSIAANEEYVPPPGLTRERAHKWGSYVTQVFGPDARLRASALPQFAAPLQARPDFHDLEQDGSHWRAYTSSAGPGGHRVQVLQSGQFRSHLAAERAGAAVAPILLLLPLSMLVLWGVVAAVSSSVQDNWKAACCARSGWSTSCSRCRATRSPRRIRRRRSTSTYSCAKASTR